MKKFLLITIFLLGASSAHACMVPMSVEDAFKHSDYVLTGKLYNCDKKDSSKIFKVSVNKVWKGGAQSVYKTTTPCDSNFLKNNVDYLLYANKTQDEDTIYVDVPGNGCSRSTRIISNFHASVKNSFSLFDGVPGKADYRIHDFDYLGKPQHIINRGNE